MTSQTIPTGLSVWERELFLRITAHIDSEGLLLDTYRKVAAEHHGEHVRYLLDLIAEDEARHHELYQQWANALRNLWQGGTKENQIPDLTPRHDEELARWVDSFLQFEREDQRELKSLARNLKDVRDTTLWGLVVELMQLDTQKHIKILEFLREHVRG
jgi:rubrerythrin